MLHPTDQQKWILVRKTTKSLILFVLLALAMLHSTTAAVAGTQHVAVQWDFNTTNSPGASLGTGTYSLLGPVSADFFGGSPSDPGLPSSNYALSLTGFPAQGEGPKTSGVEFLCDTRWWRDFRLVFDFRGSPTASSTIVILCSTNSTDFFDAGHFSINTAHSCPN